MKKIIKPLFVAAIALSPSVYAQDGQSIDSVFQQGINEIQQQNFKHGLVLTQKAADSGLAEAQLALSEFYLKGLPQTLSPDPHKAMIYLKLAAEKGSVVAMHNLAAMYLDGANGLPFDIKQAQKWTLKAASSGSAIDQNNMGMIHRQDGNPVEAVNWFRKSADQNYPNGLENLGNCYYLGYGVQRDLDMAFKLMKKASMRGNVSALFTLGTMYVYGHGVKPNVEKGYSIISKAAKRGNKKAIQFLKENPFRFTTITY